jgi:hypothetical protein
VSGHDPRAGLLSALVPPFTDEATSQRSRPPHAQRQSRAGYGGFFLSWCWVTLDVCGPVAPVAPPLELFYAWWGCAALGAYWLLIGLFGRARGPLTGGLGLLAEAAGASWLLWNRMYPVDSPLASFLLHGVYLSVLCSALAQFVAAWIAEPRGGALALVDENIAENEFDWE